jgi:WhiB family redox-sensing transcriptional regulator
MMNEEWLEQANCKNKDTSIFFPDYGLPGAMKIAKKAKEICSRCSVKTECLEFAIENREEFGIWGGMMVNERKKLISKRRRSSMPNIPILVRQKENHE